MNILSLFALSVDPGAATVNPMAQLATSLPVLIIMMVIMGYPLMVIANKTNTPNGWMGFIPILNFYLMAQIGGRSILWFILCFVPCVNIIAVIYLWMGVAEARNKPSWLGILSIVPCANIVLPFYLAFTD